MDPDPSARIAELERQVARLGAELGELRTRVDQAPAHPSPGRWAPPSVPPPLTSGTAAAASGAPALPDQLGRGPRFDSETLLKWGGVALVVLAVAFAVSTAISRGWIGPELQLVGALAVGFGLIGAGLRLRSTRRAWTHTLCSGGVLALFTTVASDLFVDETTIDIALGSTVAIGLGGAVLAWTTRSEWVAAATLAGGGVGWAVVARDGPPFTATWTWYLVLVGGMVALSLVRRWFAVRLASHLTGMIVVLALIDEASSTTDRTLLYVAGALLVASLCWVPSIGDLTSIWQQLEVQASAITALWAFGVIVGLVDTERDNLIGWTAVSVAAGAAVVAAVLWSRIKRPHAISLALGASVVLSIGVAVLLGTTATFVALAVQGVGLVVLARSLDDNLRVFVNGAVLLMISTTFAIVRMVDGWSTDLSVADDVGNAAIIVAFAVAAWRSGQRIAQQVGAIATLALSMTWLGSVLVHLPQGQALVSISWAVIGSTVFVAGAIRQRSAVAAVGLVVIGLTVAKLLTVDLREVDTLWRAALFFVVGVGLMRLGFLLPRWGRDANRDADHSDDHDLEPT